MSPRPVHVTVQRLVTGHQPEPSREGGPAVSGVRLFFDCGHSEWIGPGTQVNLHPHLAVRCEECSQLAGTFLEFAHHQLAALLPERPATYGGGEFQP